jgi:hypothetical protein
MLAAGLLVSGAWLGIASSGWSAMRRHCELAASFASSRFKQLPNPLAEMICARAQDRMHYLIVLVIAVFMAMYLGLGFMRLT